MEMETTLAENGGIAALVSSVEAVSARNSYH